MFSPTYVRRNSVADDPVEMLKKKLESASFSYKRDWGLMFKHFDKDNSGALDAEEFRLALRRVARVPVSLLTDMDIQHLYNAIDDSRNGKIEAREFVAFMNTKARDPPFSPKTSSRNGSPAGRNHNTSGRGFGSRHENSGSRESTIRDPIANRSWLSAATSSIDTGLRQRDSNDNNSNHHNASSGYGRGSPRKGSATSTPTRVTYDAIRGTDGRTRYQDQNVQPRSGNTHTHAQALAHSRSPHIEEQVRARDDLIHTLQNENLSLREENAALQRRTLTAEAELTRTRQQMEDMKSAFSSNPFSSSNLGLSSANTHGIPNRLLAQVKALIAKERAAMAVKLQVRDDLVADLRQKLGVIKSAYSQRFGRSLDLNDAEVHPPHVGSVGEQSASPALLRTGSSRAAQKLRLARDLARELGGDGSPRTNTKFGIDDLYATPHTAASMADLTLARMGMDTGQTATPYHNQSLTPQSFMSRTMTSTFDFGNYCRWVAVT